ncbi:Putative_Mak16-like RNA binding protein [Hexamita inflata]|uniref:Mak16-like RNA binding protein n=1 Tax=Hexamita inflata TaxID=28002 RepID=A0AA86NVL2_9EUKA|nr:Putative Mak16-like RNA binding protein [Hexamita inflata]CAI9928744.1 Putative Mak16-like RNA binding protein [Hexamita inflata]
MIGQCMDDLVWDVIGPGSCAFKRKTARPGVFLCTNPDSVNGQCDRTACPLANSQYASIREENGRLYLITKVIERAHLPAELWEKTEIPMEYEDAYKLVRSKLKYWEPHHAERCLLRMRKFRETFIRIRRMKATTTSRVKTFKRKQEKRELIRQAKALKAAQIEKTVEKELLKQLEAGKYNGIFEIADIVNKQTEQPMQEEEFEVAKTKERV